ncbi:ABC transporter substrate-binding protein [Fundicoccus culcitae]|uniref:ABC transporter substrate-binding protein n=1 Tax=Fundicoccus culcitae TaxID=2969821 RepID=A0ABY5P8W9_9LACT|nr:ABC transporter substrate-binding protein [Fundicoccus culcitae]UUX34979.1 ABC transporter substrate-binding protein [Fundicoccus culcitae]
MKKFKKIQLVVATAALTLSSVLGATVSVSANQGFDDTSIKVGNSAAISGAYAPVGDPFNNGIMAYFDMVNTEGGVDGREIQFVHIDDEFDPAKGKAALQTLVEDEEIFALVGHFGTPVVAATINDIKAYGIPAVYFATGIGQLYANPAEGADRVIMPVQPIYITEGEMMVSRAVGNFDATKIGIIYTTDDAGNDMLAGATQKAEELGIELVAEQVAAGATDVSAAVTSVLQEDVDFIIGAAIQQTFPTIVKALAAQGNTSDVITTYVNVDASIASQVWGDIEGNFEVYGNGWVDLTSEEAQTNLALMNEWIVDDYDNNVYAMTGWIAAHFFTEGLRRMEGQELTWDGYIDAMESEPVKNPFGGVIDFSNGQRLGTQEMNLSRISGETTWEEIEPLRSSADILSGVSAE